MKARIVSFIAAVTAVLVMLSNGCGISEQERLREYEIRTLHFMEKYRTGDIHSAKQALLDFLRLVEDGEASSLRLKGSSWDKAVTSARLALIYRHLGNTDLAHQYVQHGVAYARMEAAEGGTVVRDGQTDEEIAFLLINIVNKLDATTNPRWRRETTVVSPGPSALD
jgi:hypothetical protein